MSDHRRLINSYRPRLPAVASITTANDTLVTVENTVSTTHVTRMPGTTRSPGSANATSAIATYPSWLPSRPRLYHGMMFRRDWMRPPIGIASTTPTRLGRAVMRLTWRLLPPSRATNTGRNVPPAAMNPISADSR